jgi:prephenate dehydratase
MERSARPRVAYQGEHGAYSEEAALSIFGDAETVGCPTFAATFDAVLTGQADFATIPVENSQAGSINDTYDLLLTHRDRLTVRGEFDLHVHHCLLTLPEDDPATLHSALSHPQALAQTMGYLTKHGLKPVVSADTAGSARLVREDAMHGHAAVAGRRAAEFYNLRIVAADIEDNPYNFTKFLVLAPHTTPIGPDTFALPPINPAVTKTALLFAVDNIPGSLYRALGALAENGLNLIKIESRPARQRPWDYNFYADVEGDASDPHYQAALDALAERCLFLTVLGSYHVLRSAREVGDRG